MNFAEQIEEARRKLGLSAPEMQRMLGITRQHWWFLTTEPPKRAPSDQLRLIVDYVAEHPSSDFVAWMKQRADLASPKDAQAPP